MSFCSFLGDQEHALKGLLPNIQLTSFMFSLKFGIRKPPTYVGGIVRILYFINYYDVFGAILNNGLGKDTCLIL